jgi:hypothetical protein
MRVYPFLDDSAQTAAKSMERGSTPVWMNAAIIAAHLSAGFALKKEKFRDLSTAGAFKSVLLEVFFAAL